MNVQWLSNLPPIGESIPKVAAKGGQLIADFISAYGFFAFCLVLVGVSLMVPVHMYEKYYKVADDEAAPDAPVVNADSVDRPITHPAA